MVRNIEANSHMEVDVRFQHFTAVHRILTAEEAVEVLRSYERRHWVIAPIIRWVLTQLLGWPYTGSDRDRIGVAAQLPLVAFRSQ
jgi:hypothetical protein